MDDATAPTESAEQYWEGFYGAHEQLGSGRPNPLLVREVAPLAPGTALDLGCGHGIDAVWLAEQGWRVTGVDVSATALRRAAATAEEHGVTDAVRWERHDLSRSFPGGLFDLVSAQFFHSPVAVDGEREGALRRAAGAVAPGGLLLVASHAGWPSWLGTPPFDYAFPTTSEMLDFLDLEPGGWTVELEDVVERDLPGPEGQQGHRTDNVLRVRRAR